MVKFIIIFVFISLGLLTFVFSKNYEPFFPSKYNIDRLNYKISKRFLEFDALYKKFDKNIWLDPKLDNAKKHYQNKLLKMKTLFKKKQYAKAELMLNVFLEDKKYLEKFLNPIIQKRLIVRAIESNQLVIKERYNNILKLQPLKFKDLYVILKKITALYKISQKSILTKDKYKKIIELIDSYLKKYRLYKNITEIKQMFIKTNDLHRKLMSSYLNFKKIIKNDAISFYLRNSEIKIKSAEDQYLKRKFTKCRNTLKTVDIGMKLLLKSIDTMCKKFYLKKKETKSK